MKNQRNHAPANIEVALQHHRAGHLQQAEAIYKKMPYNPDALHLRGVIAHQLNKNDEAVELINKAIRAIPSNVQYHFSIDPVYRALNKLDELVSCYQKLIARVPNNVDAHNNLGNALKDLGRLDEAAASYQKAVSLKPDFAAAYSNLGVVLKTQGKLNEASACYQKAVELQPDFAEAYANLGIVLAEQDNPDQAVLCFQKAIALKPHFAGVHTRLGSAFKQQGKLDEATASYRNVLALRPDSADAHYNLGCGLKEQGKLDEAAACYQNALALQPDFADAYNDLGVTFAHQSKSDEAIACYRKALALKPDYALAYINLGHELHSQGRPDEAIACYQKALAYEPGEPNAHHSLLFSMQYSASHTPEDVFAAHERFAAQFETPLKPYWPTHANSPVPNKRLKIGYVSADLCKHPVAYSMEPVFARHDKSRFEVFCYYNNTHYDAVTDHIKTLADHWIPCRHMSDEQLARQIHADGIDILIDLAGHTGSNRLLAFARKPAPVQVTYLGYPSTTGLTAIDYRITDEYAEPPGMTEQFNVEQLWRLPGSFCCYRAHSNGPDVIDHPPSEDNGYVTFGCFNNFSKVTDPVIALWAKVLEQAPGARLMLEIAGIDDPGYRAEVESRFARLGLPVERVIFIPREKKNQYVLYNRIDIALDPFPCNGGTTSLDTVWMGVPFITLAGHHFTSRLGVTILTNAGLPELIAQTEEEYVNIAAALAQDPVRLKAVRGGLRERVQAGPLMDAQRFTLNMEHAYRAMWQKWCESR